AGPQVAPGLDRRLPSAAHQVARRQPPSAPSRAHDVDPYLGVDDEHVDAAVEHDAHVGPARLGLGGLGRRGARRRRPQAAGAEDAAGPAGQRAAWCGGAWSRSGGGRRRRTRSGGTGRRRAAEGAEEGDAAGEENCRSCRLGHRLGRRRLGRLRLGLAASPASLLYSLSDLAIGAVLSLVPHFAFHPACRSS
ncbi:uncharacterized protein RHOBADRAFT_66150, partial [Rhodotorula graminis WP1]